MWGIGNYGSEVKDRQVEEPIKRFATKGNLDPYKLALSIEGAVKNWRPF